MKKVKRQAGKKIIVTLLSTLTIVNVFCLGFASFIYNGPSSEIIGNINVQSGSTISFSFPTANAVVSSTVTQHGFNNAGTIDYDGKIELNFDIDFNIKYNENPQFTFSIEQQDNINEKAYSDFNFLNYLTNVSLITSTNNIKAQLVTKSNFTSDVSKKKKMINFSLSDQCFAKGYTIFTAKSTLSFNFKYTEDLQRDSDFAEDVFAPIYYGKPTFNLELKGNA